MAGYEVVLASFCRRAIVDRESLLLSIVDIMPFLAVNATVSGGDQGEVQAQLAPFTFVALLRRTDPTDTQELRIPLKGTLKVGNDSGNVELPTSGIPAGSAIGYVTVNINGATLKFPSSQGRHGIHVSFELHEDDKQVCEIKLPVLVDITAQPAAV